MAIQPSRPIHRDHIPGRRAGNDRLAGPGVDREVTRAALTRQHWDRGMLSDEGLLPGQARRTQYMERTNVKMVAYVVRSSYFAVS